MYPLKLPRLIIELYQFILIRFWDMTDMKILIFYSHHYLVRLTLWLIFRRLYVYVIVSTFMVHFLIVLNLPKMYTGTSKIILKE